MPDFRNPAQLRYLAERARRVASKIAHFEQAYDQLLDRAARLEALAEELEDDAMPRVTLPH